MARAAGTKDPSTRRQRNEVERQEEILFLMNLAKTLGPKFEAVAAARVLNDRRATAARAAAVALGESPEAVEAAVAASQLSRQVVARDIRIALERMRAGTNLASALWLDDQIAEARHGIEQLANVNDMLLEDLRRSRTVRWTRTRMERVVRKVKKPGEEKEADEASAEPVGMVTHNEEGPARAALYMVFIRNIEAQGRLRAEIRQLRFGRLWFPDRQPDESFTESLMQIDDPEKARKAALEMLANTISSLCQSEQFAIGPGTAQAIQAERLRLTAQAQRVRQLQEFVEIVSPEDGPRGGLDVVVTRRTARSDAPG